MNNMERKQQKKENCLIFLLQGDAATEGKSAAGATHLICMAALKVSPDRGRKPRDGPRRRSRHLETARGRVLGSPVESCS